MLEVKVDEQVIEQLVKEEIQQKLKEVGTELVFWDWNELMRRTCMSRSYILDQFFYNEDFPKYKVGGKWLFPAEKTKRFLLEWLETQ